MVNMLQCLADLKGELLHAVRMVAVTYQHFKQRMLKKLKNEQRNTLLQMVSRRRIFAVLDTFSTRSF